MREVGLWKDIVIIRLIIFINLLSHAHVLLALLGEADILAGQVLFPRSPPDALASFAGVSVPKDEWIVEGICEYVPQVRVL